jgi:cellulose biosynthesis protein BcsQ
MHNFPYIITISSEKGGVGKTTLATNLAIFLKALREDLPVTIFSFDNHFTVDRMFAFKGQPARGTVADLLMETPAADLLHLGQYGVNYIPSSAELADLKHSVKGPMVLARLLATSDIPGVVIIDTRPDLDILTQNALYTADRAIIPVKDMPSLENCRNIFDLFDKRGLDKKSLSLIPCLIDSRIKFDGPFKDQRTLLKAYAINRGYRSFDTFISKSPKVESLNTNPDGRIYPILTHARGTEVFSQFMTLARILLDEIDATAEPRSLLFSNWHRAEEGRKKEAFFARMEGLRGECACCGRHILQEGIPAGAPLYYYETSDMSARGFLEEKCFLDLLMSSIYNIGDDLAEDDPTRMILQDSARESLYLFTTAAGNDSGPAVECSRFDLNGSRLSKKAHACDSTGGPQTRRLGALVAGTLSADNGTLRNDLFLFVHPPHPKGGDALLAEENYRQFSKLKKLLAASP